MFARKQWGVGNEKQWARCGSCVNICSRSVRKEALCLPSSLWRSLLELENKRLHGTALVCLTGRRRISHWGRPFEDCSGIAWIRIRIWHRWLQQIKSRFVLVRISDLACVASLSRIFRRASWKIGSIRRILCFEKKGLSVARHLRRRSLSRVEASTVYPCVPRNPLCEKSEGYFDFKQLKLCAHVGICNSSI